MRLLLVEDEVSLSKALTVILERNHYSCDAVFDGEEAADYLETGNYDAVILDVMLPKKDGITVLKELRESGNTVPVIMLTAKSEIDDKILGLDSGANDYLTKPFDTRELLARIRSITRSQTSNVSSTLQYGNVSLDLATFELSTESSSVRLTNKEFQILEMLMRNPRNVVSSESLFEKIWGYDSDAEMNTVWVYISYLRKKLSSLHADIQIKALRGVGYSLEKQND